MDKLQQAKDTLLIIKDDISGWLMEAVDNFISVKPEKLIIPAIIFLFILFEIGLKTTSQVGFYVILIKFILAIISSYILYKSFHQYFLSKLHDYYLNVTLKKKTLIKRVFKQIKEDKDLDKTNDAHSIVADPGNNNYELNIVYIVQFQKKAGAINARRFIIEAIASFCILAYIYFDLIFVAIAIIVFILFRTVKELDSLYYFVREEVKSLAWNIYQYDKAHPKKCKKLITESEYEEIQNLKTLYNYLQMNEEM